MFPVFSGKLCQFLSLTRLPSILFLGVFYVAYVLVGGLVFWKLEGWYVLQQIDLLKEKRIKLLEKYPCVGQNGLRELAEMIKAASVSGLSPDSNDTADGFWKFTSSSVFAATVVTTIGYGNIIPLTTAGQIFCVLFALFGIPLNVVILNRVGKYMLAIERNFCNFLEKKIDRGKCVRISIHSISFVSSALLYFLLPMLLFKEYEGWSYAEAIYYCFITLSTIGFGDYVADHNPAIIYPEWYSCMMAAWIFFGLAWLALLINHSIDLLETVNAYLRGRKDAQNQVEEPKEQPEKGLKVEET
ncbi:potassium channel subfamily K member 17 [Rhinichthys klamathensis goyatoka]|uniref:potassium channel subfamily K member 17 n=1 Tax=Rhinichthys klamathensis goyatoka TaxID=3034132 RepID=UPI0024B53C06|nr:potassium channel subfamily K member 17 [Rhinichthys klamathensis goyatoka]